MLPNFQTPSLFLGLFLRKNDVMDYKQFSEALPWRLPEFDNPPQIRQLPPNSPPDMSRVLFTSKDRRLILEVAQAKVSFRIYPGSFSGEPPNVQLQALDVPGAFDVLIPQASRIHTTLSEHFGMTANRVGILTEMIAPVASSANQRMHRQFLGGKNTFGERLHELHIQALSKTTVAGDISVNRWIRVRPLRQNDQSPDMAMAVDVDINTLPEQSYDLSAKDLADFLKGVKSHIEGAIPLLGDSTFFD